MFLYSFSFLFLFLPAAIVLFAFSKDKKNSLFILSVLFLGFINIGLFLILAVGILVDFIIAIMIYYKKKAIKTNLFLLRCAILKAFSFILYTGLNVTMSEFGVHIAVMMITLSSLGYVIDIYKGKTKLIEDFKDFFLYVAFFGKVQSGSLMASNPFVIQINKLTFSYYNVTSGFIKFLHGLALKVIIADELFFIFKQIKQLKPEEETVLSTWALVIIASLMLYFTLLSLNIMAIGVCKIFSITVPKNFSTFQTKFSIGNFVSRFNVTINAYISKYLYLNLKGASSQYLKNSINIIITSIFMGVWFGVSWNLMLWGIYIGVLLIFEVYFFSQYFKYIPRFFTWIYMSVCILVSVAIFIGTTPMQSFYYIKSMFGFAGVTLANYNIIYILLSHFAIVLIAALLCTGWVEKLSVLVCKKNKFYQYSMVVANLILFVITVSFMSV